MNTDLIRYRLQELHNVAKEAMLRGKVVDCPECHVRYLFEQGDPLSCLCPSCRPNSTSVGMTNSSSQARDAALRSPEFEKAAQALLEALERPLVASKRRKDDAT